LNYPVAMRLLGCLVSTHGIEALVACQTSLVRWNSQNF
jgi:hypothetical protein